MHTTRSFSHQPEQHEIACERCICLRRKPSSCRRLQACNLAGLGDRKREAYRMPPRRVRALPQMLCELNHD